MKQLFISLILCITLFAGEIQWYDDYDEALRVAQKENKLLYIFISSAQCGWCQKFEATTLQDATVQQKLIQEFVAVHLVRDFDTIPAKFQTRPVPRHYFTDRNGKIVYENLGYRKVDTFMAFMGYAKEQTYNTKEKK